MTGKSGRADYTRVRPTGTPRPVTERSPYTRCMKTFTTLTNRVGIVAILIATLVLSTACGGDKSAPGDTAAPSAQSAPTAATASNMGNGPEPDTSAMGAIVLEKINVNPGVEGKATLVEFKQKSVATEALGDSMKSAVVEFEGVVTFSSDVQWSWQGPTKAGEPQKFEARAEFVNQGKGWELVLPLGIYPL